MSGAPSTCRRCFTCFILIPCLIRSSILLMIANAASAPASLLFLVCPSCSLLAFATAGFSFRCLLQMPLSTFNFIPRVSRAILGFASGPPPESLQIPLKHVHFEVRTRCFRACIVLMHCLHCISSSCTAWIPASTAKEVLQVPLRHGFKIARGLSQQWLQKPKFTISEPTQSFSRACNTAMSTSILH